jgi:GxxExxY protein
MDTQGRYGFKNTKQRVFAPVPVEVERGGKIVLGSAYRVHTALGPGLLESVYEACLVYEIRKSGLKVETQVALPVIYDGVQVDAGLRRDVFVENCVIIELKSVETINPVYEAQLLTCLKLSHVRPGYLINFNVSHLRDGFTCLVV